MDRILVVEDDRSIREVLALLLREANYTVYCAENGKEALEILRNERFDLILLDLIMPVMDGPHFLAEVETEDISVPQIIVMTAASGIYPHRFNWIKKPFQVEDMLARVDIALHVPSPTDVHQDLDDTRKLIV